MSAAFFTGTHKKQFQKRSAARLMVISLRLINKRYALQWKQTNRRDVRDIRCSFVVQHLHSTNCKDRLLVVGEFGVQPFGFFFFFLCVWVSGRFFVLFLLYRCSCCQSSCCTHCAMHSRLSHFSRNNIKTRTNSRFICNFGNFFFKIRLKILFFFYWWPSRVHESFNLMPRVSQIISSELICFKT